MSARSVTHATFVIERTYDASPRRVFAAFADPAIKSHWFGGPEEWGPDEHEMDFRVGGRETSRGGPPGGPVHAFEARYYDIVPDERIVFAYEMHLDERRISVSLATVELKPAGAGTQPHVHRAGRVPGRLRRRRLTGAGHPGPAGRPRRDAGAPGARSLRRCGAVAGGGNPTPLPWQGTCPGRGRRAD